MEIDRLSFADRAAARLRHEVVHGKLAPGTRLVEMELAARLNIGRGTIRAALSALEAEDLIVKQPYSGWAVHDISRQELRETYTLRSALEGLAARLVAGSLTAEVRSNLDKAFHRLHEAEESGDSGKRVEPSVAEQAIREHCEDSLADDAHDFAELQRQLA